MPTSPRSTGRALLGLACATVAVAVTASVSASQSRPPRITRMGDDPRVVLRLETLEIRCAEQVPATCGLSPGSDLAVLSLSVRNRGPAAYAGHLDGFTLLGAPPAGQTQASSFDQLDTTSRACAPAAGARDLIAVGGDLRVGPGRVRTVDAMFEVPRGSHPLRALYHDDDFPKCLSLPAVSYSSPACRPHARRPPSNIDCHFFEH